MAEACKGGRESMDFFYENDDSRDCYEELFNMKINSDGGYF
jgi:hypothetical protein